MLRVRPSEAGWDRGLVAGDPARRRLGAGRAQGAAGQRRAAALTAPCQIIAVEHLGGSRLRLTFADGLVGDVDLTDRCANPRGPVFEPLRDVEYFARVTVDRELATVVWPNGADLAPEGPHEQALSLA